MYYSGSGAGEFTGYVIGLTDDECVAYLEGIGVVFPAIFADEAERNSFVRHVIEKVEANPNARFHYGDWYRYQLAQDIKNAVLEYYGFSDVVTYDMVYGTIDILEDNTPIADEWSSTYGNINCYGYAIGYDGWIAPGQVLFYVNGGSDPFPSQMYGTVGNMAEYVCDDLEALGYEDITISTTVLGSLMVATEHNRLICLRRETNTGGDFHFMVLEEDGNWYHKPGFSVPLRYHYTPSNDRTWVREGLDDEGYFRDEDEVYASTIYYILYTIPCTSKRYVYNNNDTHILICSECEKVHGTVQNCVYVNNVCKTCGHHKFSGAIMKLHME